MVTETLPDYYSLLQVHPEADLLVIKKAYHTLMLDLGAHPDRGGDPEQAKLINRAWEVLQDPLERRRYDEARRRAQDEARPRPAAAAPEIPPLGFDARQWQSLQTHGELVIVGYQPPGVRHCECHRCGRQWITRSFSGMPKRCPDCRSTEWAHRRHAFCFVCHHAFAVRDLHGPIAEARKQCPACKADDWSLRPVVLNCLACDKPNRVRRAASTRARCGACGVSMYARGPEQPSAKRLLKSVWQRTQAWVDRLLLRPLGSL